MTFYLVVKFVHVFVAIVAIGGGTGLGFVQRLSIRNPTHFAFSQRSAQLFYQFIFGPGLVIMLITGFWMAATNWSLSLFWVRASLILTAIVLILLYTLFAPGYGRLGRVVEAEGLTSPNRQGPERITQIAGGGSSLLILVVIWLMVTKPS